MLETDKPTNPKDSVGVRKVPFSTIPSCVMAEVGVAMLEGAAKYGRHNYRVIGVRSSVYYDATMRHLSAWWDEGQDLDADSGLSHITKAISSLMVLRDAMIQGKLEDDRPPRSAAFIEQLNQQAAAILDRYIDRSPVHYIQKTLSAGATSHDEWERGEARMNVIGPNGNDGTHYRALTLPKDVIIPESAHFVVVYENGQMAAHDLKPVLAQGCWHAAAGNQYIGLGDGSQAGLYERMPSGIWVRADD